MTERLSTTGKSKLPAAVIFDMDGLLVDTEPIHAECFARAFASKGVQILPEDYRRAVTIIGVAPRDLYVSKGGKEEDWLEVRATKDQLMAQLVPSKASLMPGAINLLNALKSAGIPSAIATSSRQESLAIITGTFGLRRYFDCVATKTEVNVEKPDPAVFLLAARKLGIDPCHCVVMEDSPKGVLAAQRAGMKCIAVPNHCTSDGDFSLASLVIASLEQVDIEMLEKLFSGGG